jgi:tetratricopeptide (TPR) repeat protein
MRVRLLLLVLAAFVLGWSPSAPVRAANNWATCDGQADPAPSIDDRVEACIALLKRGKAQAKMSRKQTMGALHYDLGGLYIGLKRYREGISELDQAEPIMAADEFRVFLWLLYYKRAIAHFNLGEYLQAEEDLENHLSHANWGTGDRSGFHRDQASDTFGRIYLQEGRYDDAVEAFQRYLAKAQSPSEGEKQAAVVGLGEANARLSGGGAPPAPVPMDACVKFPSLC